MLVKRLPTRIRHFSCARTNLAIDLSSIIQKSVGDVKQKNVEKEATEALRKQKEAELKNKKQAAKDSMITAEKLNNVYRSEFRTEPTLAETSKLSNFFFNAKVKLDWMTEDFLDMPGERERYEIEQKRLAEEEAKTTPLNDIVEFDEDFEDKNTQQSPSESSEIAPGNGFVKPDVKLGLPEVVFLGKCNVGKSTLLNALVSQTNSKELETFAYSSKHAGFTKSMNAFNLGDRLRIIDTPGYGVKGRAYQGEQVLEYLQHRKELQKCYLLISSVDGFNHYDEQVLDVLIEAAIPYEVVFTKVDKLKNIKTVKSNIKESGILNSKLAPDLLFVSSDTNRKFPKRQGFNELRKSIFDSCGLNYGLQPLSKRDDKK
ncbi:Translation initiation factor IF-2 [Wickerhamomyces ciferrii]|uniref:Translation initiation factor IF-2 n=1 Tax=Wickerhamomyces ciferrii (strain ATCC 14091 / BCRC 22168 / CBS 111 / JCM 3599 / NBRC 0793 / NRRL Y-1031 F-60-10) TaxID=1206466 RepID=K0KD97_WICCF|nr:Translation initiation factor IF-2 [Wickerhamomyces ciferrii]CCH40871.1 Translation initiation factor IF-2 [Wickerhamomyces ciferrii]